MKAPKRFLLKTFLSFRSPFSKRQKSWFGALRHRKIYLNLSQIYFRCDKWILKWWAEVYEIHARPIQFSLKFPLRDYTEQKCARCLERTLMSVGIRRNALEALLIFDWISDDDVDWYFELLPPHQKRCTDTWRDDKFFILKRFDNLIVRLAKRACIIYPVNWIPRANFLEPLFRQFGDFQVEVCSLSFFTKQNLAGDSCVSFLLRRKVFNF